MIWSISLFNSKAREAGDKDSIDNSSSSIQGRTEFNTCHVIFGDKQELQGPQFANVPGIFLSQEITENFLEFQGKFEGNVEAIIST